MRVGESLPPLRKRVSTLQCVLLEDKHKESLLCALFMFALTASLCRSFVFPLLTGGSVYSSKPSIYLCNDVKEGSGTELFCLIPCWSFGGNTSKLKPLDRGQPKVLSIYFMLELVLLHGDPPYLEVKAITRSQAIVSRTVVISQTQVSEPAIRVEVFPVVKDATFNSATVSPAYRLCTNKPLQILDTK